MPAFNRYDLAAEVSKAAREGEREAKRRGAQHSGVALWVFSLVFLLCVSAPLRCFLRYGMVWLTGP